MASMYTFVFDTAACMPSGSGASVRWLRLRAGAPGCSPSAMGRDEGWVEAWHVPCHAMTCRSATFPAAGAHAPAAALPGTCPRAWCPRASACRPRRPTPAAGRWGSTPLSTPGQSPAQQTTVWGESEGRRGRVCGCGGWLGGGAEPPAGRGLGGRGRHTSNSIVSRCPPHGPSHALTGRSRGERTAGWRHGWGPAAIVSLQMVYSLW